MQRRKFLQLIGISTAVLNTKKIFAMAKQYNLLIIHTDEHNFRTLGCYRDTLPKKQALMWGKDVVETPNIDWIAKNGALCTSFYATTPVLFPVTRFIYFRAISAEYACYNQQYSFE